MRSTGGLVAALFTLAACASPGTGSPESEATITAACTALLADSDAWTNTMRAVAVMRGKVELAAEDLVPIERDKSDFSNSTSPSWYVSMHVHGERVLGAQRIDGSYSLPVWVSKRAAALTALHEIGGQQCWWALTANGDVASGPREGVHRVDTTRSQYAAIRVLMMASLEDLAGPVACPHPSVERVVRQLRSRSTDCDQAMRALEPWTEELLPGLLHAMVRSLSIRHDGEGLQFSSGPGDHAQIGGYHTPVYCVFDLLCFASQGLRGFLTQANTTDEGRAAEVRALATWLRFRRLGMEPARFPPERPN